MSHSNGSSALGGEAQNPTPFPGQDHGVPENHPYDPSSVHLSSDTTSQRRLHGPDLIAEWGWEIAAWLLAAVSLVALLSVFGTYSGNPLSQWRSGITPSTVVQILSQFGQTALLAPVTSCICQSMWLWLRKASKEMQSTDPSDKLPRIIAMQWYDDGSRGPLGSLMLLWKHPALVWLGTINTFLIILFGTFAQQTLQLPLQEHNGTFPVPQGTLNTFVYQSVPDLISAAITDGLLRTGVSPSDIPGDCPTGNCTFPAYQTMGVCSNVIDVSSTITSKCRKRASQFRPNGCNYSVPAIDENPTATERTLTTYRLGETLWIGASNTPNYKYPDINTLVQFYIIYVPDLTEWATLDYTEDHKEKLVALQATLNLCLYTYATRMTFGVTRTAQFAKSPDLDWQSGTASGPDENTSFQTVTTSHDSETFWMSQLNVKSFNDYLSLQTFTGSASMRPAGPSGGGNTTETDTVRVIASSIYDDPGSLYGIKTVLDNLAVSMTNGCGLPDVSLL
ncbi:MAG: hypothetical protein Q9228_004399 [Teloschistes exilis]